MARTERGSAPGPRYADFTRLKRARNPPPRTACVPRTCTRFSPDGRLLAISQKYGVALWSLADPAQPRFIRELADDEHRDLGHTEGVLFTPDGRTVIAAGSDGKLVLWNMADRWHPVRRTVVAAHLNRVEDIALSPDGRLLATSGLDRVVKLWDITDPDHPGYLATVSGHRRQAPAIGFSSDARTLFTDSDNADILAWDTSALLTVLSDPQAAACRIAGPALSEADWNLYLPGQARRDTCGG